MSRITLNIELDSKPDRNGLTAVMVRLHQQGQPPARLLTDVKIEKASQYWLAKQKNKKPQWGKWVGRHPDSDAINARILSEHNRIKSLIESWQTDELRAQADLHQSTLTPKLVAERYKARLSESYFDLTARVLENSKALSFRTYSNRSSAINLLAQYAGDEWPLQRVTVAWVESFQDYLKNKYISPKTGGRLKPSSINQYMEVLNTVHVEVLRLTGHTRSKAALLSPFTDVDRLPAKSVYRAKYDEVALDRIDPASVDSVRRRVTPEDGFSVWLLSRLLAGMRVSDVLMLRYRHFQLDEHGKPVHLKYEMMKTGNVVSIPIFEQARHVLAYWWREEAAPTDYLLPYLTTDAAYATYTTREELYAAPFAVRRLLDTRLHYWNGQINSVLSEIQKAHNLPDKLRMHNARHSFADMARRIMQEDGSLSLLDITNLLGQRDPRMVMTYIEEMEKQDATAPMSAIFQRKKKE